VFDKLVKKNSDAGGERYRKAALTSIMNVASQFLQIATGLISVPLTLNYVGLERFGLWMALTTALAFITFADFGIGIGTQDRMSRLFGAKSHALARRTFYSSISAILIPITVLMGANAFIVPNIDLSSILSLKSKEAAGEIILVTQVVVFLLALGVLAGIIQRAFNALQEGFLIAIIQVFARICSLILLFVVVDYKMGLPAIVFVVSGLSSVALLFFGFPLLLARHRWLLPSSLSILDIYDREGLKDVLKVGLYGLGASIAIYLVSNSAPVLIAVKYDAESVADYSVLLRLLSVPGMLLTYLLLPLWPAITDANAKRDQKWIKGVYKKASVIALSVGTLSALIFLMFGQHIIFLWTQNSHVVPGYRLLLATVCFMVLGIWNTLTSVMLNGLSMYKSQATYGLILALGFVLLASLAPPTWEKDMIVWIVCVGYFCRCALMQTEVTLLLKKY
jgi:O-antigen/teichoic acid export membrane protein